MYNKGHEDVEGLIKIFEERGMVIKEREKMKRSLSHINYYKIKELAEPFFKNGKYTEISFEEVIGRFYQDKNLRVHLLHAIEEVELSFKTKLAYILGKKSGAFGYLSFNNWCNKEKYCRYYIKHKEKEMKKYIEFISFRGENSIIKKFFSENLNYKYPPVWMIIEILTFGDVLKFYELMSTKNREDIADFYECSPSELESWLKSLKFIRNLSAHNTSVIDSRLKTNATVRKNWKKYLYIHVDKKGNKRPTNRIALILPILIFLLKKINPNYKTWKMKYIFSQLICGDNRVAQRYGFSSSNLELFNKDFNL